MEREWLGVEGETTTGKPASDSMTDPLALAVHPQLVAGGRAACGLRATAGRVVVCALNRVIPTSTNNPREVDARTSRVSLATTAVVSRRRRTPRAARTQQTLGPHAAENAGSVVIGVWRRSRGRPAGRPQRRRSTAAGCPQPRSPGGRRRRGPRGARRWGSARRRGRPARDGRSWVGQSAVAVSLSAVAVATADPVPRADRSASSTASPSS